MTAPVIILDRPQMGENIGACARAMMNCGLRDLRLVRPRDGWPNPAATTMAAHAASIIEGAQIFDSVAEAAADLTHMYATTARERDQVKRVLTARAFGVEAVEKARHGAKVGVLFGKESTGLENDDVARASAVITVPLNPENTSLNLGQACLLIGYEWFQTASAAQSVRVQTGDSVLASNVEVDNFLDRLVAKLDDSGFLGLPHKRPKMRRNLRNVFQRAELTSQEVQTLFGVVESLYRMTPPTESEFGYAVIFETRQSEDLEGYAAMAAAMIATASRQPGFQRIVSAHSPGEVGITVSYWDSLKAIHAWGQHHAHKVAQQRGNDQWYQQWVISTVRVMSMRQKESDLGEKQ